MITFKDVSDILKFLDKAGFDVRLRESEDNNHYLIVGAFLKEPIGRTDGISRIDVLAEEPYAIFEKINEDECPICNE